MKLYYSEHMRTPNPSLQGTLRIKPRKVPELER